MTMKTALSSVPAKQLQWWLSPDRRRQAVPGMCSRYREGAVTKRDASRWRHNHVHERVSQMSFLELGFRRLLKT